MRYMLMVYMDQEEFVAMDPGEGAGTEPMSWDREMEARGVRRSGSLLRPAADATTVRVRGEEVLLSDGPFAETKEQIAGFDVVECEDLDEAIEVASKHPAPRFGADRGEAVLGVSSDVEAAVAAAFREEWGRVVATLIRIDRRLGPRRGVRAGGLRAGARDAGRATASRAAPAPG